MTKTGGNLKKLHAILWLFSAFLMSGPQVGAQADQQSGGQVGISNGALPEEPRSQIVSQKSGEETSSVEGEASVSGVVLDTSGAAISDAKVTLTSVDGSQRRTLTSGANGEFTFTKIAPGSYLVIVEAPGLEPLTSAYYELRAQ